MLSIPRGMLADGLDSGYGEVMTLEAIKQAVVQLGDAERRELADWFENQEEAAWDREIERDFALGGRGAGMVEDIDRAIDGAIASGKVTPLGKGLSMRSNRK